MSKTWLITGTSTGLGRLLTERLLERGDRVAATLRRPGALDDLIERRFWGTAGSHGVEQFVFWYWSTDAI